MKKHGSGKIVCAAVLAAFMSLSVFSIFTGCDFGTTTTSTEKTMTSIKLYTDDVKTAYLSGDQFSSDGLVVKPYYSNHTVGSEIDLSSCTITCDGVTCSDSTYFKTPGTYSIKVTYGSYSKSYSITVTDQDNYVSYSSWANHSKWNLANTHDPTVVYWSEDVGGDGYYYMWGTDASYGNEALKASSGKHFSGKRSKDLVNWEWVPGPFDSCPTWVNTKLNEIRATMREEKLADGETLDDDELQDIDMTTSTNASYIGYWAPCARVVTVDGVTKIRMYYSIVADYMIGSGNPNITANFDGTWSERAFIGVCETTDPDGGPDSWTDLGFVTCSSSDKGTDYSRASTSDWSAYFYFNAIDPTYFIDDDDTHWLIYGSWHSGFAMTRINPETGKIAAVSGSDYLTGDVTGDFEMGNPWADDADGLAANGYGTRIYTRNSSSRWQGSEGPELVKHGGYYYLFFANDGLAVPYQTRVVRATSVTGPYYDITGADVTAGTATKNPLPVITHPYKFDGEDDTGYGWVGFSHCAVFQDADGNWFYMSQARFPENVAGNAYSNAIMMGHVRRIEWVAPSTSASSTDLWPMVSPERYYGYDMIEADEISASDIAGTWEHINLAYSYGNMDTSEDVVFTKTSSTGGTVSGALTGSWSFDSSTNLLTIGTRVVKVQYEQNWEGAPREKTLVYSGIGASNITYWGKKVSDDTDEVTYASKYADATLKATYTMTISDTAIDDLAWYLYPQWGEYTLVAQNGSEDEETVYDSVTGTGAWWTGTSENKSQSFIVADGETLTMYTTGSLTLILEAYSETANTYADVNPHKTDNGWGDAVTTWGSSDSRTAVTANADQSLKITITRSGNEEVMKIYQL